MPERCSMCEVLDATVMDRWPAPVCGECDSWLDSLGADLKQMEAEDPALAAAAARVDEAVEDLHRHSPGHGECSWCGTLTWPMKVADGEEGLS